jgi:uncharacterized repeat protein (TIGR01451 family)
MQKWTFLVLLALCWPVTSALAQCPAPTGFQVVRNYGDSLLLNWNAVPGATSYMLEWGVTNFAQGTGPIITTTDTFTTIPTTWNFYLWDVYLASFCNIQQSSWISLDSIPINYQSSRRANHAQTGIQLTVMSDYFGLSQNFGPVYYQIVPPLSVPIPANVSFYQGLTNGSNSGFIQTLKTDIGPQDEFNFTVFSNASSTLSTSIQVSAIHPGGTSSLLTMPITSNGWQVFSVPLANLYNSASTLNWASIKIEFLLGPGQVLPAGSFFGLGPHAFVDTGATCAPVALGFQLVGYYPTLQASINQSNTGAEIIGVLQGTGTQNPVYQTYIPVGSNSTIINNLPPGNLEFYVRNYCYSNLTYSTWTGPYQVNPASGIVLNGRVSIDLDSNCQFDGNPTFYDRIKYTNGNGIWNTLYSNSSGHFGKVVPNGNYQIAYQPIASMKLSNSTCTWDTVNVNTGNPVYNYIKPALVPSAVDVRSSFKKLRQNFNLASNSGVGFTMSTKFFEFVSHGYYAIEFTLSDSIQVVNNPQLIYGNLFVGSPTKSASGVYHDTIFVSNIYSSVIYYSISTYLPFGAASLGDTLEFKGKFTCLSGDADTTNNSFVRKLVVVGPYDPNDKLVTPGITTDSIAELDYTIRFQNVGNAPAVNVVVVDTLSADLDPLSLIPHGATHDYYLSVEGQVATWTFPNIQLPDSASDPEGSNGQLWFTIQPHNTLQLGDSVRNKAEIYFDFNPPIITPWAVSKVVAPANPVGVIQPTDNVLRVYPNPTRHALHVELAAQEDLHIVDLSGRILMRQAGVQGRNTLPVQNLKPGTYLLVTESGAVFKWLLSE